MCSGSEAGSYFCKVTLVVTLSPNQVKQKATQLMQLNRRLAELSENQVSI